MSKKTSKKTKDQDNEVSDDPANRRQHPRRSVLWPGKISVGQQGRSILWPATIRVSSHEFHCQIWNMSLGGARVRLDVPLREGAELYLSVLSRDEIPAKVVWTDNESIGLEFQVDLEAVKELFKDRLHILGVDQASDEE